MSFLYPKLVQVVMSFHECGGNVGDDMHIPLPRWVVEIGRSNPDIYFTNKEGRRNTECLSWGIDKERVLKGRTAVEVIHLTMIFRLFGIFIFLYRGSKLKKYVIVPFLSPSHFMFCNRF